jgi:glycosyltransferase involved in cell wall biosynthesis
VHVVLVSWTAVAARARSSVQHAIALDARVHVLDLDDSFRKVADETVARPQELGIDETRLRKRALVAGASAVARSLQPLLLPERGITLVLEPGVLLLTSPEPLLTCAADKGLAVVARDPGPLPADGRHPDVADLLRTGAYHSSLLAVRSDATATLEWWRAYGQEGLDAIVAAVPHGVVRDPAVLLGPSTLKPEHVVEGQPLTLDGRPVAALDLSQLDPRVPWLLDSHSEDPRARLSEHPVLAAKVEAVATEWLAEPAASGSWDPDRIGLGLPVDDTMRQAGLLALSEGPDLLDPAQADAARRWLVAPPTNGGLGPYLLALHRRPDLSAAFPGVPGPDEARFVGWATQHAVDDGAPPELVAAAVAAARPATVTRPDAGARAGVNVVGFLGSELGIGESARLLLAALQARGIPHSTTAVDRFSQSRSTLTADAGTPGERFDTTILCVNSDLTPTVAGAVSDLLDGTYRIGMWYWEVEDFPRSQHGAFSFLDEIWVATDFVRRAIEPHAPIPVRTVPPPLPQRGEPPVLGRAELGLPDRPYVLFSFDFLSTAERKNPFGLVEAFTEAFEPDEGPLLVVKSINADKRPLQAERLRLAAARRSDILLVESHFDAVVRDALVAHCFAYASLHRAEGLGLTLAEAMAWGKPVIATAYSGNLQFMTDDNSFLVPWRPATVPAGAAPYPPGGTWADPDLHEAARLLRQVWDEPDTARARGEQAARDIAELYTPEIAGEAVARRLAEIAEEAARRLAEIADKRRSLRRRALVTAPLRIASRGVAALRRRR